MAKKHIILTGFMGCGKTTVGKALAHQLGYDFMDSDVEIEKQQGISITDIFQQKGEPYFRELETQFCLSFNPKKRTILSVGGGLILSRDNFEQLSKVGQIVFLDVPFEELYERIKRSDRPLVKTKEQLKRLWEERLVVYKMHSHGCVVANRKSPVQVIRELLVI